MNSYQLWTSFYTMLRKDVVRMFRIWVQTFLPNVVTAVLYFSVFGAMLGSRIGEMQGVPYMHFVVPGIVMLAIVTTSYANSSFTFFASKFFARSIDEILVSPTPPWLLVAGFAAGGVLRGILVGTLVLLVSLFFTDLAISIDNALVIFAFASLTALVFALAGLVNGIYAKSIDAINLVPTFILTPLVYLGGVFYSVEVLPAWWHTLTLWNPVFYIVNGFRFGFLGIADVPLAACFGVLGALAVLGVAVNWYLLRTGLGLRQ